MARRMTLPLAAFLAFSHAAAGLWIPPDGVIPESALKPVVASPSSLNGVVTVSQPCPECLEVQAAGPDGCRRCKLPHSEGGCHCDEKCRCVNPCHPGSWYQTDNDGCYDPDATCPVQFGLTYKFFMCGPGAEGGACLRNVAVCDHPYALFSHDGIAYTFTCYEPFPCGNGTQQNPLCSHVGTCFSTADGYKTEADFAAPPPAGSPGPIEAIVGPVYLDTPAGQAWLVTSSAMDEARPPRGAAAANCTDGVRNGGESDADCGGACPRCAPGKACRGVQDCSSGVCESGICAFPTCSDGVRNGMETGVDCGGCCPGCPAGSLCLTPADCLSGVCNADGLCGEEKACFQ